MPTSEEVALSIIHACKGDPARVKEAAAVIEQFKMEAVNCDHADWSFETQGRCCFKCGIVMMDFGD